MRRLYPGVGVIQACEGVMSMKSAIIKDEKLLFCSEKCLVDFYNLGAPPSLSSRIP